MIDSKKSTPSTKTRAKPVKAKPRSKTPAGVVQVEEPRATAPGNAGSKPAPRATTNTKGADGLTDQQRMFVAEYLRDRSATKAAVRAGYAPETARQQGSRLLTNVVIRRLVNSHHEEVLEQVKHETGITLERTLREIARISYFDPRKLFDKRGEPLPITELDDDTAAVIAGLDVLEEYAGTGKDRVLIGHIKKWKIADKLGGLDKLMKHLGGYKEDNKQQTPELSEQLGAMLASLHQSGAGRLPMAPKRPKA